MIAAAEKQIRKMSVRGTDDQRWITPGMDEMKRRDRERAHHGVLTLARAPPAPPAPPPLDRPALEERPSTSTVVRCEVCRKSFGTVEDIFSCVPAQKVRNFRTHTARDGRLIALCYYSVNCEPTNHCFKRWMNRPEPEVDEN